MRNETGVIVYIWGNLTVDNFTPRPNKDTVGGPGQQPGLSASNMIPTGRKAQAIDTDKLKFPLQVWADEPSRGGTPGHFAIAPANESGDVDLGALAEWAQVRGTGATHRFTQALFDAVIEPNARG